MQTVTTIEEVRRAVAAARAAGRAVAFVPTMGYFHEGHLELMRAARSRADAGSPAGEGGLVVVSLFVNPTQFGPGEDFARYPRDLPRDAAMAASVGVDLLWTPTPDVLYPPGFGTMVSVGAAGRVLCGADRPGHFDGVATVVLKLLAVVAPDVALFGWKDAQQFLLLRRMARDFHLAVALEALETVREADGLAMSSRNVFLTPAERAEAPALRRALLAAGEALRAGGDAAAAGAAFDALLAAAPRWRVVYREVRAMDTLEPLEQWAPGNTLVAAAVRLGTTRLIDNLRL